MIADLKNRYPKFYSFLSMLFSRENVLALILAIILISIYIMTAADAPLWLYQGF
jgi:hypothetical protein